MTGYPIAFGETSQCIFLRQFPLAPPWICKQTTAFGIFKGRWWNKFKCKVWSGKQRFLFFIYNQLKSHDVPGTANCFTHHLQHVWHCHAWRSSPAVPTVQVPCQHPIPTTRKPQSGRRVVSLRVGVACAPNLVHRECSIGHCNFYCASRRCGCRASPANFQGAMPMRATTPFTQRAALKDMQWTVLRSPILLN